jgi:hypothetical protein
MTQTSTDTTIEEIHAIRRNISDRFNGDVFEIARDAARRQLEANRPLWCPKATNNPMHPSGGSGVPGLDTSTPAAG